MATAIAHGSVERAAKPWIKGLARVGFVAKALLYFTIGLLAAAAALGLGGGATDTRGAMTTLFRAPFGRVLLAVIAAGLVGYAAWRIIAGILDGEHRGKDAKGIAMRAGSIGRGLVHLALAGTAASLVVWQSAGSHDGAQQHWTARALATPGGIYLVWAAALTLLVYGAYQLYRAVRAKLNKRLELGRCSPTTRRVLVGISRFGIGARAIVIGTVGVLLVGAARHHDPKQAGGLDESLRKLFELGTWPFLGIAFGLVAYGVYELVEARFRRIDVS